jgi:CDP-glucose 4,6-dehydratase
MALWLERLGAEVYGLSLSADPTSLFSMARMVGRWPETVGDVRDKETVHSVVKRFRPTLVVHLAAQPLVSVGWREPVQTFETNVLGAVNVMEAARRSNDVRGCLIITTDKVYRPTGRLRRHQEGDPLGGPDPYSASKAGAEQAVAAWRHFFSADLGRQVVAARAGNVIGGGDFADGRLMPDLIRAFSSSVPAHIRQPDYIRPWQHVLDPLAGYLSIGSRIVEGMAVPEAVNFGPLTEERVAAVADMASISWGKPASWIHSPDAGPPELPELALDSSLASRSLGWSATWATDEAVHRTVSWWKHRFDGKDAVGLCMADIDAYEKASDTEG